MGLEATWLPDLGHILRATLVGSIAPPEKRRAKERSEAPQPAKKPKAAPTRLGGHPGFREWAEWSAVGRESKKGSHLALCASKAPVAVFEADGGGDARRVVGDGHTAIQGCLRSGDAECKAEMLDTASGVGW
jgi:hypothetical protein